MAERFFISFNSADRDTAHWIGWILQEAGHQVAIHDWELPAGGNIPLWMNDRLKWADRLIAVVSPDYLPATYSPMEWAAKVWLDPKGAKGLVVPVVVRPVQEMPPLLAGLSQIDLKGCSEDEAERRLLAGIERRQPPEKRPRYVQRISASGSADSTLNFLASLSIPDGDSADRDSIAQLHSAVRHAVADGSIGRANRLGLSRDQVLSLLRAQVQEGVRAGTANSQLEAAAEGLASLRKRLFEATSLQPKLQALVGRAQSAIERGQFDAADQLLSHAESHDLEAGVEHLRRASELAAGRGALAFSQAKFLKAADHFSRAAALKEQLGRAEAWELRIQQADALYEQGLKEGTDHIWAAVRVLQDYCTEANAHPNDPAAWSTAQARAARALVRIGERAEGSDGRRLLRRAVHACEVAIEVAPRKKAPLAWAEAQNTLGSAYLVLGMRGERRTNFYLHQAILAYEHALKVRVRSAFPFEWAKTRNNQGIALKHLGTRTRGSPALSLLRRARKAYLGALSVYIGGPLGLKADTLANLGALLTVTGERIKGPKGMALLLEAAQRNEEARSLASEYSPAQWAWATLNLAETKAASFKIYGEAHDISEAIANCSQASRKFQDLGAIAWSAKADRMREKFESLIVSATNGRSPS